MDLAPHNVVPLPASRGSSRVMPCSIEAEASVVGGILLQPRAFSEAASLVDATDFYDPKIGAVYAAMVDLDNASRPIDPISVAEQMRANDTFIRLRAVGGEAYLAELASGVVTVENITFHAQMVRGKAMARRLIETAQTISANGYGDYGDVQAFIDRSEQMIFEVTQQARVGRPQDARALLSAAVQAIETRYNQRGTYPGVPSGYDRLDALLGGWQAKRFYVVACRPSMGKTALALCAMRHAALVHGIPQLFFSCDSSKEQIMARLLSQESRVDSTRLRDGCLDQRDFINLTKGASRIAEAPIWVDDTSSPTLLDIRSKARRWRANPREGGQHKQAVAWVDYLTLIDPQTRKGETDARAFGRVSAGLKELAKLLDCAVVALCQLNRGCESRADKRPTLPDLRETGAIEQDADAIAFIYRDEVYNHDSPDKGVAEVNVAKQKDGPTGCVRLCYLPPYMTFENLAERGD